MCGVRGRRKAIALQKLMRYIFTGAAKTYPLCGPTTGFIMPLQNKEQLVLACLAASEGKPYDPVQIQKLIFLFQEKAPQALTEKFFNFQPKDYGPFDPSVYSTLEELSDRGVVEIHGKPFGKYRLYRLRDEAEEVAQSALDSLDPQYRDYLKRLSEWVKSLSFAKLIGSVYKEFPEMKVNSVFREVS